LRSAVQWLNFCAESMSSKRRGSTEQTMHSDAKMAINETLNCMCGIRNCLTCHKRTANFQPIRRCFHVPLFTGCPTNVTISSSTNNQAISGQTVFNCTSYGGYPDVTYQWYNESSVIETGSQYSVQTPGTFALTCVAKSTTGREVCSNNKTVNGTAIGWSFFFLQINFPTYFGSELYVT
jgi:hypothetical protein